MFKRILKGILIFVLRIVVLAVVVIGIRYGLAAWQVGHSDPAANLISIPNLGSTKTLSILPLYEEGQAAQPGMESGHGVSYLIRTDQAVILLDAGNSSEKAGQQPFEKNMQLAGLSLDDVNVIVISHNHPDHVGGIQAWQNVSVNLGSGGAGLASKPVYLPVPLSVQSGQAAVAGQPAKVAEGVAVLGAQPFLQPFPFWVWEPMSNEQSLAIKVEGQGLVLITGCGHPSLENIVTRAEATFDAPVVGVAGGLHYEGATTEQVAPHINFLASRNPQFVALSPHDNGPAAIEAFRAAFPEGYQDIVVGKEIQVR